MILIEIQTRGAKTQAIPLHRGLTVVASLDAADRAAWAGELRKALGGQPASLILDVEVDGRRERLTAELARRLGLDRSGPDVTVLAADLPGAGNALPAVPVAAGAPEADDGVASALAAVRQHEADLAAAEQAAAPSREALASAEASVDPSAAERVQAAAAALEAFQAAAASADERLRIAGDTEAALQAQDAERDEIAARTASLPAERAELEARRGELVARRAEIGGPADPRPVEEAVAALLRLREVKPKLSRAAAALGDRWVAVREQLAALPSPPEPPRWLVAPALAALHEARAALAAAEGVSQRSAVDPELMADLDRAHRQVLDAEQKLMKKSSRLHRKRLDHAHAAEQSALARLGVANYGEYLRDLAPRAGGGPDVDRAEAARAVLADAESVWEELHGGLASPEWTAAKEEEAEIRAEAAEHLGREVEDEHLEARLRSHLEAVVDTGWAEAELGDALRRAGVPVDDEADVLALAEGWLAGLPAWRASLAQLDRDLTELDRRLGEIEAQLAEHRADLYFGSESRAVEAPGEPSPLVSSLEAAAGEARAAAQDAEAALAAARERLSASEEHERSVASLRADAAGPGRAVDEARERLGAARDALAEAKAAPPPAAPTAGEDARSAGEAAAGAAVAVEAELYLLARLAALGGNPKAGPLPLVVDAGALSGLSVPAAGRLLALLERASGSRQVVVLGDEGAVAGWAEQLGDRAVLRPAAR